MAFKAAENSESLQRHGAVVVKNGNVLSIGINKDINHPTIMDAAHIKAHASVHAEARALARVANPAGATIYVARALRGTGEPGNSKPCSNCAALIRRLGVKRVVHS